MRVIFLFIIVFSCSPGGKTQELKKKLTTAMRQLEADSQMQNAIIAVRVVESKTGNLVFERNAKVGLTPASTQKIITSIAAFELLGKDYQYETSIGYSGKIANGMIEGDVYITGTGDPSLGSWRFENTNEEKLFAKWISIFKENRITGIRGGVHEFINKDLWSTQTIPGGWIWEDIGNYYGAGSSALNWRENQYDIWLKPGKKIGDKVEIIGTRPRLFGCELISELITASANSGDNAYIYLPPFSEVGYVRGSIPSGNDSFVISGAFPNPSRQLTQTLTSVLKAANMTVLENRGNLMGDSIMIPQSILISQHSPTFDSLNYWFMKKSINLYGEAFIKSIARKKGLQGSTENGVKIIQDFFSSRGIERTAINIMDGSGLSPQNRVTAEALVSVLQYCRSRPWFPSFFYSLPEFNGMKMKSGSIGGARAFAGYHRASNGKEYTFTFIINNFNGPGGEVVKKMYKFLDLLK